MYCRENLITPTRDAGLNLDKLTMRQVYQHFGLESGTQDFIGHALALYLDDESVQSLIFSNPTNPSPQATSTNLLARLTNVSSCTPPLWHAGANPRTSTLFM